MIDKLNDYQIHGNTNPIALALKDLLDDDRHHLAELNMTFTSDAENPDPNDEIHIHINYCRWVSLIGGSQCYRGRSEITTSRMQVDAFFGKDFTRNVKLGSCDRIDLYDKHEKCKGIGRFSLCPYEKIKDTRSIKEKLADLL